MKRMIMGVLALLAPASLFAQDRVDSDALMQDLRVLSSDDMAGRQTGTPGGARARTYIERRLAALGLEVHRTPFRFTVPGQGQKDGANVWTLIRGTEQPDKVIVVSAHYDHLGVRDGQVYNGADDNASGTAAILAIAENLQRRPARHSVLIVAFDAEELGLFGSRTFMQGPPVPAANILLDINMDMVARGDGAVLWVAGPRLYPALRPVVTAVASAAAIDVRYGQDYEPRRPGRGRDALALRSDQAAFGFAGIPWVFFTAGEHTDYHRPTDDAEKIDGRFYSYAVAVAMSTLRRLDADDAALETARRDGSHPRWTSTIEQPSRH
jgi:Zn-dependent M28 family amino/carboxypeptidase